MVYRCAKQYSEPCSDKRGAKVDAITRKPLQLIDRIAALVPPQRTPGNRYFGVLAPNASLRAAVDQRIRWPLSKAAILKRCGMALCLVHPARRNSRS